jgi:hypothetical protein
MALRRRPGVRASGRLDQSWWGGSVSRLLAEPDEVPHWRVTLGFAVRRPSVVGAASNPRFAGDRWGLSMLRTSSTMVAGLLYTSEAV